MTREIAHQKSFEKALYAIRENFPTGKLPGNPEFTDKFYRLSEGDGEVEGPWNSGKLWEVIADREDQVAVDGGDGEANVKLSKKERGLAEDAATRTASQCGPADRRRTWGRAGGRSGEASFGSIK